MKKWRMVLALGLLVVGASLAPHPAQARVCPAPGTGLAGAKNMTNDAKMLATMVAHVPPEGWAGMHTAVVNSACP